MSGDRAPKRGLVDRMPTRAKIKRLVTAAEEAGIKIGGLECTKDGTIRVLSERLARNVVVGSDYDDWKRGG